MDGRDNGPAEFVPPNNITCNLTYPFGSIGKVSTINLRSQIGEALEVNHFQNCFFDKIILNFIFFIVCAIE